MREAIGAANTDADYSDCVGTGTYGTDTITFAVNYTITLGSQLPAVTTPISVEGKGAANTIIQASACNPITLPGGCTPASYRVFAVTDVGELTLNALTVRYGRASGSGSHSYGGGVFSTSLGSVTIMDSVISGNKSNLYGGGVYSGPDEFGLGGGGALTVTNTIFADNLAFYGGGVYVFSYDSGVGAVSLTDSSFSGNEAIDVDGLYDPALYQSCGGGGADYNVSLGDRDKFCFF